MSAPLLPVVSRLFSRRFEGETQSHSMAKEFVSPSINQSIIGCVHLRGDSVMQGHRLVRQAGRGGVSGGRFTFTYLASILRGWGQSPTSTLVSLDFDVGLFPRSSGNDIHLSPWSMNR